MTKNIEDSNDLKQVVHRGDYNADYRYGMLFILFIQIIIIVVLSFIIAKKITNRVSEISFISNDNNQLITPVSIENPNSKLFPVTAILNLTTEAVIECYSFNYRNLETNQVASFAGKLSWYFDQRGLAGYYDSLKNNPIMQRVIAEKLIVSAQPRSAPQIIGEEVIDGHYAWRIKLPVALEFQNIEKKIGQRILVDILVWRVPETESPLGIKITNYRVDIQSDINRKRQT